MASRISLMIDCPGCRSGFSVALMAAWLSVKITHLEYCDIYLHMIAALICMAFSSAAYTLNAFSLPRCWILVAWTLGLNVAAPIFPPIPDPSV